MKTCWCEVQKTKARANPTTGEELLLCDGHALAHDRGHTFTVHDPEDYNR